MLFQNVSPTMADSDMQHGIDFCTLGMFIIGTRLHLPPPPAPPLNMLQMR